MKKSSFRKLLLTGRCPEHKLSFHNTAPSVTDPTLALTGTQLAVASMLGQPIPQPAVNYSFNSATTPELVSEVDSIKADAFEIYARYKQNKKSFDELAQNVVNTPEYQEFKNNNNSNK